MAGTYRIATIDSQLGTQQNETAPATDTLQGVTAKMQDAEKFFADNGVILSLGAFLLTKSWWITLLVAGYSFYVTNKIRQGSTHAIH